MDFPKEFRTLVVASSMLAAILFWGNRHRIIPNYDAVNESILDALVCMARFLSIDTDV